MALAIVGGIIVLVGIVAGFFAYRALTSPEGQKMVTLFGQGAKLTNEAMNAPGTSELKKLGCNRAMVMDREKWLAYASLVKDASTGNVEFSGFDEDARSIVVCSVSRVPGAPTCDVAASTYHAAAPSAPAPFILEISGPEGKTCRALYSSTGAKLRDLR